MFRLLLYGSCLIMLAGCASPALHFKNETDIALERLRGSGIESLFPLEVSDFYNTVDLGDVELATGEIQAADSYYRLAVGKAEMLESLYIEELKRRSDAALLEAELKRQAEAELKLLKQKELEKAELLAREAARVRRLEAEKVENRRRAERARQEKEVQLVNRHTVKRGETLPQIAAQQEIYGDSSMWPIIYKANRDQISNPGVLWPGQVLRIPRSFDKNDINDARRFSLDRSLK